MKKISLEPIHDTCEVRTGTPLLQALQAKKLNVLASCGGRGLCATCHVHVKKGSEALSPRNDRESRTLSFISGTSPESRLACQVRVYGHGAVVELPRGMYIERAEDLLDLLGTRAPDDILHPVTGIVLVAQGKIITRARIEELKNLGNEVKQALGNTTSTAIPRPKLPPATATPTPRPVAGAPKPTPAVEQPRPVKPAVEPMPGSSTVMGARLNGSTSISARPEGGIPRPPVAAKLEVGAQIGKCLLTEKVGQGSSGVVFRALHKALNLPVAVKAIVLKEHQELLDNEDADIRLRLRDEARLMAQLNHPNIIRVWDFDEEFEFPYVVLELVEGLSLAELIQQSGRLTLDRAAPIIRQVADGLAAAWTIGIVHRDVKPGNILLTKDGRAKVADLGLAWVVNRADATSKTPTLPEGTMAYMAPEQAVGSDRLDFRSDIYALGATFFHAITGRMPFPGRSWQEVMMKHARVPLEPPHTLVPELSPAVSAVIGRMMAKDPNDRYPDYTALMADIDGLRVTRSDPAASAPGSSTVGKSSKWLGLFGGLRR